jgi:hypothetical protein
MPSPPGTGGGLARRRALLGGAPAGLAALRAQTPAARLGVLTHRSMRRSVF